MRKCVATKEPFPIFFLPMAMAQECGGSRASTDSPALAYQRPFPFTVTAFACAKDDNAILCRWFQGNPSFPVTAIEPLVGGPHSWLPSLSLHCTVWGSLHFGTLRHFRSLSCTEWLDIHIYLSRWHGSRIVILELLVLCALKVTPHLSGNCNGPCEHQVLITQLRRPDVSWVLRAPCLLMQSQSEP